MFNKKGVAPLVIVIVLIAVAAVVWYGASSEEGEEGLGNMFSLFGNDYEIDYSGEYEESIDAAITCKDDHDCFEKTECSEDQKAVCKTPSAPSPGGFCECVDKGGFGNELPELNPDDIGNEVLVNNAGCFDDPDCTDPDKPYCVDGTCESSLLGAGCIKDEDCLPTQSLECGTGGKCVLKANRCLTDKDCPANSPACNKNNGECVLCLASGDLADGTNSYCKSVDVDEPYCLSAVPACHECIEDFGLDCTGPNNAGKICNDLICV